jgi:hypothetical protein
VALAPIVKPTMVMRVSPRFCALIAAALFVQFTSGCLSNQYRIPQDELWRISRTAPEARGQRVRAVQDLGERRSDAIEPTAEALQPPPPPPEVEEGESSGSFNVNVQVGGGGGDGSGYQPGRAPASWRGSPQSGSTGFRGTPPRTTGWHGGSGGGGKGGGGGGGGGGLHISGGGGGGGNDGLVVLAVVVVVTALFATVALAGSEGARFDGYLQMAPDQPIHLKDARGTERVVPLALLSDADVSVTAEAKVMDDEGPGVRRLDERPLDRTGGTFKLDLGASSFNFGTSQIVGPASQIQAGYFVNPYLGFLVDVGLSGGEDCCGGGIVSRHSLGLEAQFFPLNAGRLHLGGFGGGGAAIAGGGSAMTLTGPVAGGGALMEIDVSPRMALTFRAGASAAKLDNGWSSAGTLTAGVAIY